MEILNLEEPVSVNNKIVVEAYQREDLKHEVKNGFAMISQKSSVKGLELLMDAKLSDGTLVVKGYKAYIKESDLHAAPWAKVVLQSDAIEGKFMIIDLIHVEFFGP